MPNKTLRHVPLRVMCIYIGAFFTVYQVDKWCKLAVERTYRMESCSYITLWKQLLRKCISVTFIVECKPETIGCCIVEGMSAQIKRIFF